jgi:hypothetical protein
VVHRVALYANSTHAGLANIFAYQSENVVLRDIINKTNVAESRAGVMVVGLDTDSATNDDDPLQVGDDNDEDSSVRPAPP